MKLLSIVLLVSLFSMPVASLAIPIQTASVASDCPLASIPDKSQGNVNDAKNIVPANVAPSNGANKANATDLSQQPSDGTTSG